jgi:hypothetical protein
MSNSQIARQLAVSPAKTRCARAGAIDLASGIGAASRLALLVAHRRVAALAEMA